MKRLKILSSLALLLALSCLLYGCGGGASSTSGDSLSSSSSSDSKANSSSAVLHGEIVSLSGGSALICSDDAELCTVELSGPTLYDENGETLTAEQIEAGMLVDIAFSGSVLEIYPTLLVSPENLTVTGRSNGLVGMYFQAIRDIIAEDPGLNDGISVVSVDLTGAVNLTDAQREALVYMTGCELGCEWLSLTYGELRDEGYIDDEGIAFEDGILISVSVDKDSVKNNSFTFDIRKWRSVIGAIFYSGCRASLSGGEWSYEVGSFAIS